jgi:MFS family permease
MLVILVLLAFFAIALPDAMLGVAWPFMRATFDQPLAAMTLVLPFGVAATLASTIGWTWLAARLGLGRLLTGSIVLSTVALLASALAPGYWLILICAVLFGLSAGAIDAALNAYAARHFGPRLINLMHAAYGIGAATSPLAVTAIVSAGASWRWAYLAVMVVQGALALLFGANSRRWQDPPPTSARARSMTQVKTRGARGLRGLSLPAVAGLLTVTVESGLEAAIGLWAFVFLLDALVLPPAVAGVVVSGYWASLVVGRLLLGALAERVGTWPVLAIATSMLIAAAALLVSGQPIPAAAGVVLLGFAAAPIYPLLVLTTAERTTTHSVDRLVGFQAGASTVGAVSFSTLTGLMLEDDLTFFPFCVLVLAVLTIGGVWTVGPARRSTTRSG